MIIRGENVVLMGEIVRNLYLIDASTNQKTKDLDAEDEVPLQNVPIQELEPHYKQESDLRKRAETEKAKVLFETLGFSKEGGEGDGY
jgi:U6 snRNA-associated Sm-like protein LSm1